MNIIDDLQNEKYFYDHVKLMKYSYIYISMYTKYKYTDMCESI